MQRQRNKSKTVGRFQNYLKDVLTESGELQGDNQVKFAYCAPQTAWTKY